MASGQGPGPPRRECGEAAPSSTSEEQVARDTEEVFRSYVFYRHRQEQEAEGAAVPADPEMVTLPLEPSSTMGQVGRQLAIIGDDINQRYDSEFQAMLQHLQPTAENAYEYFTKIASRPAATPTEMQALPKLRPDWGSLCHPDSQLSHFAFQLGAGRVGTRWWERKSRPRALRGSPLTVSPFCLQPI
nr:bcl-2 homologous antagonist/killer isoform X3 [Vulpes vulpes]